MKFQIINCTSLLSTSPSPPQPRSPQSLTSIFLLRVKLSHLLLLMAAPYVGQSNSASCRPRRTKERPSPTAGCEASVGPYSRSRRVGWTWERPSASSRSTQGRRSTSCSPSAASKCAPFSHTPNLQLDRLCPVQLAFFLIFPFLLFHCSGALPG